MKLVERARAAAVVALLARDWGATAEGIKHRDDSYGASVALEAALAVIGELEEVEVSRQRGLSYHFLEMPDDCRYENGSGNFATIYMKKQKPKPTVEELTRAAVDAWQEEGSPTWHKLHVAMAALAEKLDKP